MTESKKTSKTRQNFDFGMEPKEQHFILHASRSLLCIRFVVVAFQSKEEVRSRTGPPCDLFWPRPGSAPGQIWPKNNNTCKGPCALHPYQVS